MDAKSAVEITPGDNSDNISELLDVKVCIFSCFNHILHLHFILCNIIVLSIVSQYTYDQVKWFFYNLVDLWSKFERPHIINTE